MKAVLSSVLILTIGIFTVNCETGGGSGGKSTKPSAQKVEQAKMFFMETGVLEGAFFLSAKDSPVDPRIAEIAAVLKAICDIDKNESLAPNSETKTTTIKGSLCPVRVTQVLTEDGKGNYRLESDYEMKFSQFERYTHFTSWHITGHGKEFDLGSDVTLKTVNLRAEVESDKLGPVHFQIDSNVNETASEIAVSMGLTLLVKGTWVKGGMEIIYDKNRNEFERKYFLSGQEVSDDEFGEIFPVF